MALKGFGDTGLEAIRLHGKRLNAQVTKALVGAPTITRTMQGAGSLSLTLGDPDYELIHSKLLTQRVALSLDGLVYEYVGLRKAQRQLTLTFEDGLVADLRRKRGPGPVAAPGTSTRTAFMRRLVSEVKYAKFRGAPTTEAKVALSRGGKHGGGKRENTWDTGQRLAGDRAWRCFADEETVFFGPDEWLLGLGTPFVIREGDGAVDWIDWEYDGGKHAQTATVTCWFKRWAARPGTPVLVQGQGDIGNGLWLISDMSRALTSQKGTVQLVRKTRELPEPKPDSGPHDDSQADGTGGGASGSGVTSAGWQWPAHGPITSDYGAPRSYGGHTGIDIGVPNGTTVWAAKAGTVTFAGVLGGYGNCVDIDHGGGLKSRYGHLQSLLVRSGHQVDGGDAIARSNNTGSSSGPHLHFGTYRNGAPFDPKDVLP